MRCMIFVDICRVARTPDNRFMNLDCGISPVIHQPMDHPCLLCNMYPSDHPLVIQHSYGEWPVLDDVPIVATAILQRANWYK